MTGAFWLARSDLDRLIQLLKADGRAVIAPTISDGAIVYEEISRAADLPQGTTDEQAAGTYRLTNGSQHTFDFASSPSSWKRYTFPPVVSLGKAHRSGTELAFEPAARDVPKLAFFGVRACDVAALKIQGRVLAEGPFIDDDYVARRWSALVIAVECAIPSGTCFCSSMGTGPEVTDGHDLALTELDDGFVVRAGSVAGRELLLRLQLPPAATEHQQLAAGVPVRARDLMGEPLPIEGLTERLQAQLENPRWAEVADRCLACTNCTMVCPTCFCTSVTQHSDLLGEVASSERRWDTCFTVGFASVAGGNFRRRVQDRYRQWLTHKFATWVDQFGSYGCVGCGRCITWCPAAIDVREEFMAIAPPTPVVSIQPAAPTDAIAGGPGRYAIGTVLSVRYETADTFTIRFGDLPAAILAGAPGQFLMLDLPGFSGVPISVSRYRADSIDLTIRAAGPTTRAITALLPGAQVGIRGPLGRGWPLDVAMGRDVVIVAGGIGIAPVRPLIDAVLRHRARFAGVRIYVGARTPADMLFHDDLADWGQRTDIELDVTVDRGDANWSGPIGVVTQLFDRAAIDGNRSTAYVCGPEKMMQAASRTLAGRGLMPERVYLSMERHMECGIGLCGHCQMGKYFVCKDGPVFTRRELGDLLEVEGV